MPALLAVGGGGLCAEVESTGLSVDASKRNEVVAFWNRVYRASDGYAARMGWTGGYGGTCNPGTTSAAFHGDVERRINFFRALAGIEASAIVNNGSTVVVDAADRYQAPPTTLKEHAVQRAALMFSYAGRTSHDPASSSTYPCLNSAGWNGAARGNISLGLYGPDAIDAYMRENDPDTLSSWSDTVKHRRWILRQGSTNFASGDVPGHLAQYRSANVLYVVQRPEEVDTFDPKFVGWPSPGFFPDELVPTQWSFGHPVASFSGATVQMFRSDGSPLPVTLVDRTDRTAGGAIVWTVPAEAAAAEVTDDTTYRVRVQGIVLNGVNLTREYEVTVIDPDRLIEPMALEGTAQPPVSGATYLFEPVGAAESYTFSVSKAAAATWVEGAEDGTVARIVDGTSPAYALRAGGTGAFWRTGTKSFRLIFPSQTEPSDQWFVIDREILPKSGAKLEFYLRRGYMTAGMVLDVQTSTDGTIWTTRGSWPGVSNGLVVDSAFVKREIALEASETPLRVRFLLRWVPGQAIYWAASSPSAGAFIDDIATANCDWVTASRETPADAATLRCRLDSGSAGEPLAAGSSFRLRLSARVGGRDYLSPEVRRVVVGSPLAGFELWMDADHPAVGGGFEDDHDGDGLATGIEYAFHLDPADGASRVEPAAGPSGDVMRLAQPVPSPRSDVTYGAEWSDDLVNWSSAGVSVAFAAGEMTATLPAGTGSRFVRWKITRP